MTQTAGGIMERLRDGTRMQHDAAEGHAFQQAFFSGKLPQSGYAAYLGQMHHVYAALEGALRKVMQSRPEIADVIRPHCFRADDIRADLKHLGSSPEADRPLPATRELVARIERDAASDPLALLGMHYVLEGSNNGNRFIARNIQRAYNLTAGGLAFLDPYGEEQKAKWQQYKDAMGKLPFTPAESDRILDAAQEMFRGIGRISTELYAAGHV